MTPLDKAAAEYATTKNKFAQDGTRFTPEEHAKGFGVSISVSKQKGFKAGARWALECVEVKAMQEALEFPASRWAAFIKHNPGFENAELTDGEAKRERAAYEALAAFDELKEREK